MSCPIIYSTIEWNQTISHTRLPIICTIISYLILSNYGFQCYIIYKFPILFQIFNNYSEREPRAIVPLQRHVHEETRYLRKTQGSSFIIHLTRFVGTRNDSRRKLPSISVGRLSDTFRGAAYWIGNKQFSTLREHVALCVRKRARFTAWLRYEIPVHPVTSLYYAYTI